MKRATSIGAALAAALTLGAMVTSSAQAETAPFDSIGGTRLAAGKTHNITGHAIKPLELVTPANSSKIICTGATPEQGVMLGSEAGTEGHGVGISKFEGCELKEGNGAPSCHLAATEGGEGTSTTITTNPLKSELVENVEGSKAGKKLEQLTTPASGSIFVTIFFGGSGCTIKATKVTGSTAGEVVTDPGEASIELPGPTPENTAFIIKGPSTPITSVWLVSGGVGKIVKVGQEAFTNPSEQFGAAVGLLANSKFEPENIKWSPLP
jgi:hypothetical protein